MKMIEDQTVYKDQWQRINSMIDVNKTLPDQVFKNDFSQFIVIEDIEIFDEYFFKQIQNFLKFRNEDNFWLSVVSPHPESYFFHNFQAYSMVNVTLENTADEYIHFVNSSFQEGSADGIFTGEILVAYSESMEWLVYVDRDYEIGIIGFKEPSLAKFFAEKCDELTCFSMKEALDDLIDHIYTDKKAPRKVRKKFLKNYSTSLSTLF